MKGETMSKTFDELDFTDDYMFCKVMEENEDLCKQLIEIILEKKIRKVVIKQKQKSIDVKADSRGVRLDVYVEDEADTVFDLEMQAANKLYLPLRTRYYQGMIDLNLLGKGIKYNELRETYIIFICVDKPFEDGKLHKYTFINTCQEDKERLLNDNCTKIFVTPKGEADDISDELKAFLQYLVDKIPRDEFTKKLDAEVNHIRASYERRLEYMTLYDKYEEIREEGRIEGREESIPIFAKTLAELGLNENEILAQEVQKFGVDQDKAKNLIESTMHA